MEPPQLPLRHDHDGRPGTRRQQREVVPPPLGHLVEGRPRTSCSATTAWVSIALPPRCRRARHASSSATRSTSPRVDGRLEVAAPRAPPPAIAPCPPRRWPAGRRRGTPARDPAGRSCRAPPSPASRRRTHCATYVESAGGARSSARAALQRSRRGAPARTGDSGSEPLDEQAEQRRQPAGVAPRQQLDDGRVAVAAASSRRPRGQDSIGCESPQPRGQGTGIREDRGARDPNGLTRWNGVPNSPERERSRNGRTHGLRSSSSRATSAATRPGRSRAWISVSMPGHAGALIRGPRARSSWTASSWLHGPRLPRWAVHQRHVHDVRPRGRCARCGSSPAADAGREHCRRASRPGRRRGPRPCAAAG